MRPTSNGLRPSAHVLTLRQNPSGSETKCKPTGLGSSDHKHEAVIVAPRPCWGCKVPNISPIPLVPRVSEVPLSRVQSRTGRVSCPAPSWTCPHGGCQREAPHGKPQRGRSSAPGTSVTPLQIMRPRRRQNASSVTSRTVESGLEISAVWSAATCASATALRARVRRPRRGRVRTPGYGPRSGGLSLGTHETERETSI